MAAQPRPMSSHTKAALLLAFWFGTCMVAVQFYAVYAGHDFSAAGMGSGFSVMMFGIGGYWWGHGKGQTPQQPGH